jgi:UDP-3-O-acyl N-acetylglucosamine deacetylase
LLVRTLGFRPQRTLAGSVEVRGVGLLTGVPVRLCFKPASPGAGVRFVRTDLRQPAAVEARPDNVTGTARRTTLGRPPAQVTLVEHVLAALSGLRIDNCLVEVDGPEPPGLDGSAGDFVTALESVGVARQAARRWCYAPTEPVVVRSGGGTLGLYPGEGPGLTVTYLLDYGPGAPIPPQRYTAAITPDFFRRELAPARTFLLAAEAEELRRQGVGQHLTPADVLVFGPAGPVDNHLHWADEPARHKVLDVVGDLSLCGVDLAGHVVACRSGHPQNVQLAGELVARLARAAGRSRQAA